MSCFSIVPRSADRPLLLVAGMVETAGLEVFARMEKKVHEALIKAEFCPYLQVIRRAEVSAVVTRTDRLIRFRWQFRFLSPLPIHPARCICVIMPSPVAERSPLPAGESYDIFRSSR